MKKTLFITGITGFIGTNFLQQLDFSLYEHVFGVGRTENDDIKAFLKKPNFTFVKADILEPDDYIQYLKSSDIIVHMAALTGKASRDHYFQINREATQLLLSNCKGSKIERFIFVSSIAVKFQDIKHYYYAQSKIAAEEDIKNSTIPHTIIRPTIVIGEGSPILLSLKKIVEMPVVPIFGDGKNEIQPIFVNDLINCILHIINQDHLVNEIIEIGGPEKIEIENLIKRLHLLTQKRPCRSIHIPISPLTTLLSVLEKYFLPLLPFTAGQLASFSNSGTSEKNTFFNNGRFISVGIDEMLSRSLYGHEVDSFNTESLKKECCILSRYLIDMDVNEYTEDKYIQGHKKLGIKISDQLIDHVLLKRAGKNAFWLKVADVYSSVFYPRATIRYKILLMIAVLECGQSTYVRLDSVGSNNKVSIFFTLAEKAAGYLCWLMISIILFGPFHAISNLGAKCVPHK